MKTSEVRQSFIDFFKSRGHEHVRSSLLVPAADPTLLFTNAGMVQFKQVFQGLEKRDYSRAVTVQKCVRAGGKHNDLEEVGHTARHHTFFEMLGNFSFGDYFKRDAIEYGWEWVTSEDFLGIDPDRLFVSVHHTDDEARDLWHEVTGISKDRIYGLGDKDNFWQMADTGPCGPCSEIFVDIRHLTMAGRRDGGTAGSGVPTLEEFIDLNEAGHLLEIWNLVFMQFDQAKDGSRTPLPAPSVDTGAGAERIAAVKQDVASNYDTKLFLEIIKRGEEVIGKKYDMGPEGAGFRVLADHARAVAFLLTDGVYPSNDGRGYVLRRILRRGVRHAYLLGRSEPTLVHMADAVVDLMGDAYPELKEKASHIEKTTRAEEERFLETIEDGLGRLDEITVGPSGTVSGDDAFKLYDTYGFPVDLTEIIAEERGWTVDQAGFKEALKQQQQRSKRAQTGGGGDGSSAVPPSRRTAAKWVRVTPRVRQKFVGYEKTVTDTVIISYRKSGARLALILKDNPFYVESGGQVSDMGEVIGEGWKLRVEDVFTEDGKVVVEGTLDDAFKPSIVTAMVDEARRSDTARNHTATHLAHAALRKVLGDHVRQSGSVVAPDRLRFDFSHHSPIRSDELAEIEAEVNRGIWQNADVNTKVVPYDDALSAGAMALFGEKYSSRVRTVRVPGISLELCGGTHVRTTGQIGSFHITSESGIAAGVRRIEAVTGPGAYGFMKSIESRLAESAAKLRTGPEHVAQKIETLLDEKKKLEKQVEELLKTGSGERGAGSGVQKIGNVSLLVDESPVSDRAQVGLLMDSFRGKNSNGIKVVFTTGDRPSVFVAVTDDLVSSGVKAGELANAIGAISGGRGGGRPHFASCGVGDVGKLDETKAKLAEVVEGFLSERGLN